MTLSITMICHYAERRNAECYIIFIVMLNIVMLSVIKLSFILLSVVALTQGLVLQNILQP